MVQKTNLKMNYKQVKKCQISNSRNLKKILSLGLIPPVNQMFKTKSSFKDQEFYPTELFYCSKSHLVQLGIEVDKKILFPKNYPYTSSTTRILRDNFFDLANEVTSNFNINKNDLVIDIGSNDGNLLSNFKKYCKVLGVTPENIASIAIKKGIPTVQDYFSPKVTTKILKKYGKAKIITATNVFAHIEEITKILKSIKKLMKKNSLFITESHYLVKLIKEVCIGISPSVIAMGLILPSVNAAEVFEGSE